MTGLAPDGGLLVPKSYPQVRDKLGEWSGLAYQDLAFEIMSLFADDFTPCELREIIAKSYAVFDNPEITPVVHAGPVAVCELFHGPTLAFKDVALQFLGNCFEKILGEKGGELNVVVATSGDTGSAAIHGLRGRKNIRVFVLYPNGRVSSVQEAQMTSVLDPGVFNIALEGSFDDAQAIVKGLFNDLPFKKAHNLGAVNSINWARILAQIAYYFHSGLGEMRRTGAERVSFAVPTGNFGDIFAGYAAAQMGLPVAKLVLATNENDILARFFKTGIYAKSEVRKTISPSMDIQISSNFERWLALKVKSAGRFKCRELMDGFAETGVLEIAPDADGRLDDFIVAERVDTRETLSVIKRFHSEFAYLPDPHTAVGIQAALSHSEPGVPMICLATAHPGKFPEAIAEATDEAVAAAATPPRLGALKELPKRKTVLPDNLQTVADFIAANT